jgi:hypothetical protein
MPSQQASPVRCSGLRLWRKLLAIPGLEHIAGLDLEQENIPKQPQAGRM